MALLIGISGAILRAGNFSISSSVLSFYEWQLVFLNGWAHTVS